MIRAARVLDRMNVPSASLAVLAFGLLVAPLNSLAQASSGIARIGNVSVFARSVGVPQLKADKQINPAAKSEGFASAPQSGA